MKGENFTEKQALDFAEKELAEHESRLKEAKKTLESAQLMVLKAQEGLEAVQDDIEAAKFKVEAIKRKGHIEEIFWRFPLIGSQIFENLDNETLVKCRKVSTWWKKYVDSDKTIWIRQVQKYIRISNPLVNKTLKRGNQEFLKELTVYLKSLIPRLNPHEERRAVSLLDILVREYHKDGLIALDTKNYYLIKLIIDNLKDKNPTFQHGFSILSKAAYCGYLEVCELIIKDLEKKNPRDQISGATPLHHAAKRGHFEVCELFLKNVQNLEIYQQDRFGNTPFDNARNMGRENICDLFERSRTKKSKVS